jgi:hypothetical protein
MKLLTESSQKSDLTLQRWATIGACFTTTHHSWVTYWGYGMVQQQQMRCHDCKPCELWSRFGWMLQTFERTQQKQWLCLAEKGPHRSLFHNKTTHHALVTYRGHGIVQQQQMRWHMGAHHVSFGPDLVRFFFELLTWSSQNSDFAWQRWALRSLFHNKTSLTGHIWRTWNGLAATNEVSWLQTMW